MAWVNLLDIVWPVGSIYHSNVSDSPAKKIGGTWVQITNAVMRAYNGTGYDGNDNHTLTLNQIPPHSHEISHGDQFRWSEEDGGWANFRSGTASIIANAIWTQTSGGGKFLQTPKSLPLLRVVQNSLRPVMLYA